jgi:hypothetical protein
MVPGQAKIHSGRETLLGASRYLLSSFGEFSKGVSDALCFFKEQVTRILCYHSIILPKFVTYSVTITHSVSILKKGGVP